MIVMKGDMISEVRYIEKARILGIMKHHQKPAHNKNQTVTRLAKTHVLEAVKLPALVTGLDTGLAQMDRDALAHGWISFGREKRRGGIRRRTAHNKRSN